MSVPAFQRHSNLRRVAWVDWSEWKMVYSLLFSVDASARIAGLKFVKAWQSRTMLVPAAIESTASFVELFLYDGDVYDQSFTCSGSESDSGGVASTASTASTASGAGGGLVCVMPKLFQGISEYAQRLVWAMAITRFVNSVVDPAQQKLYSQSVCSVQTLHSHALSLRVVSDLPVWIRCRP
jgi:hypothetical protein